MSIKSPDYPPRDLLDEIEKERHTLARNFVMDKIKTRIEFKPQELSRELDQFASIQNVNVLVSKPNDCPSNFPSDLCFYAAFLTITLDDFNKKRFENAKLYFSKKNYPGCCTQKIGRVSFLRLEGVKAISKPVYDQTMRTLQTITAPRTWHIETAMIPLISGDIADNLANSHSYRYSKVTAACFTRKKYDIIYIWNGGTIVVNK